MFANRLLTSAVMPAKPDLASHSLISFLDRFVYRNAKASAGGLRGSSIMQPLAGGESSGVLVANRATAQAHQPVNSEAFWRKKAEDVAVDEVFFHKYFNQVGKGKVSSKKKGKPAKAAGDGSDGDEDENEDEIWQALVDSRPEVEGPSDDESDLEMLDLDDSGEEGSEGSEAMWEDDDEVDVEGSDEEEQGSEGEEEPSPFLDEDEVDVDEDEDEDELFNKELETNQKPEAKVDGTETGRAKKKKMKSLPMFASVDDYADMMGGDEDEDMG